MSAIGEAVFEGVLFVVTKALGFVSTCVYKISRVVLGVVGNVLNGVDWVVAKVITVTGNTGKLVFKTIYLASCTGKMLLQFFPYDVADSEHLTMLTNPAKGTNATVIVVAGTAYILYE